MHTGFTTAVGHETIGLPSYTWLPLCVLTHSLAEWAFLKQLPTNGFKTQLQEPIVVITVTMFMFGGSVKFLANHPKIYLLFSLFSYLKKKQMLKSWT